MHHVAEARAVGRVASDRANAEQIGPAIAVAADDDVGPLAHTQRRRRPAAQRGGVERVLGLQRDVEVRVPAALLIPADRGRDERALAALVDGREDHVRLAVDGQTDALDLAHTRVLLLPLRVLTGREHPGDLLHVAGVDPSAVRQSREHRVTADDAELLLLTAVDRTDQDGELALVAVARRGEHASGDLAPEQQQRPGLARGATDPLVVPVEHGRGEVAVGLAGRVVRDESLVEGRHVDPVLHRRDEGEIVEAAEVQRLDALLGERHSHVADRLRTVLDEDDAHVQARPVLADPGEEDVGRVELALLEGLLERGAHVLLHSDVAVHLDIAAVDLDLRPIDALEAIEDIVHLFLCVPSSC